MKARVIVTTACNRNCEGCCNNTGILSQAKVLDCIHNLMPYEEIIITGGEPMLIPEKVLSFVLDLRLNLEYRGKIYIYSALYNHKLIYDYEKLFQYIDGLHYTVHYEASDKEIVELKLLSRMLPRRGDISFRLSIDSRLYDRYDFSNIDFSGWHIVRKLKWQVHCELPSDEKLFIYEL